MLPDCIKTEVWRDLMESLSSKLKVPVVCGQAVFGKFSFFQELRNRKSDEPFAEVPGVRYVSVKVDDLVVYVGPFRSSEPHAFDEELSDARLKLPEWRDWHVDFIDFSVQQAVIAGKAAHVTADSLSRAKLLLEFSKEVKDEDVERALHASLQFLSRKFKLNNVLIYAYGKQARFFDVSPVAKAVEERVVAHLKSAKSPCIIKDVKSDFLLDGIKGRSSLPKAVIGFPLVFERSFVGYMVAFSEFIPAIDSVSEVLYELSSLLNRLSEYAKVQVSAVTDTLTGLYNRGQLSEKIDGLLKGLSAKGLPVSVLMTDVDNFKNYNDTRGHPEGDRLLTAIADVMRAVAPKSSLCCRYGGEEFLMVIPGLSQNDAKDVAEKFRADVESSCDSTVSVGLFSCLNSSVSWKTLVQEADRALYRAKHLGKNKVVSFVMLDKSLGIIDG